MSTLNNIEYALIETLKVHPEFIPHVSTIYKHALTSPQGINLKNFTNTNGARAKMQGVNPTDILHFFLIETVKCYNAIVHFYFNNAAIQSLSDQNDKMNYLLNAFPYYGILSKAIEIIANPSVNSALFYKLDTKELLALVDAVVNCRYQNGEELRKYIDMYGNVPTTINSLGTINLFAKLSNDIDKMKIATNVKVNHKVINNCLSDVLSGKQLKNQHNEYGLNGTLFATQDIGKRRKNQEDAVIILEHKDNPEFKLLAVSDGMGGVDLGDEASSYITKEIARWFDSIPAELYNFPMEVQQLLNKKIAQMSQFIYQKYNEDFRQLKAGATLVVSVVTQEYTINSTVGDSRIYAIRDGEANLITRDESAVWPPQTLPSEISKAELDDLRFEKNNNIIARCMGQNINTTSIQTTVIPNNSYDKIILLTDGVTDLLSQEDIKFISNSYPPERITHELVQAAITHNAIRAQGPDEWHNNEIKAGKDNATAAMYARR